MKNINEIESTLKVLDSQYKEIKKRYNQHAAFNIAAKTNHSFFVDEEIVRKNFICCDDENIKGLSISAFPFYHTSDFARLIHVKCNNCGTTWVPDFDFDLDQYYEKRYAEDIQPWRAFNGKFYSNNNPFLNSKTYKGMARRANRHIDLLNVDTTDRVLEIGPGVGIALSKMPSDNLYASELDSYCQRILQEELNVELIDIKTTEHTFDKILLSHIIEHLKMSELMYFLRLVKHLLNKDGSLLIEVPRGADQIERACKPGGRSSVIFEPHTISFSTYGLYKILLKLNFSVKKISLDESYHNLSGDVLSNLENSDCEILSDNMSGGGVVCVCQIK